MNDDFLKTDNDWRCEEVCTVKWVECMETQDGAAICKTIENNCYEDCDER